MGSVFKAFTALFSRRALLASWMLFAAGPLAAEAPLPAVVNLARDGSLEAAQPWRPAAPRAEISPAFTIDPHGGPGHEGTLVISSDARRGLHGCWQRTFAVAGGQHYKFAALRKTTNVAHPRRSTSVRILWQDDQGKSVHHDVPVAAGYLIGWEMMAEPEFPAEKESRADGWAEISDVYRVPDRATRAVVELYLQWSPDSRVEWSGVTFAPTAAPSGRKVRLAAVHYRPTGKTPAGNCREYEPFVAEAARQKADLVVLGETITLVGPNRPRYEDIAEPIPGKSTEYFGALAKRHGLYIVVGLYERDEHLIYNVAVLLGPDGKLAGKYRKVCLPRNEAAAGVTPGDEYPVFQTRFGKLGMMVCYDGFFPEVARELTNNGAEVIAWPVWGCNPELAAARACENHVYIVSSTYEDISRNWMLTAVYDHDGKPLTKAEKWGTVVTAEIDLDARKQWNCLGDFKAQLPRHRPVAAGEKATDESAGFTPMFNGKDLSGWVNVNCAPDTFVAKGDEIVTNGNPTGFLRTARHYENFVLELDWMHVNTKEVGNSGVFVWGDPMPAVGTPYTRGIEVQVLVNLEYKDKKNGAITATSHGDLFSIWGARCTPDRPHPLGSERCLPSEHRAKGGGEWNHYKVVANDGVIKLSVNGAEVSGVSKCSPRKGYLALESEGAECHFKNIKIKELPSTNPPPEEVARLDEGHVSLFDGLTLAGWKFWTPPGLSSDEGWQAGGGRLLAVGTNYLSTKKEFGPCELLFDWKLPAKAEKQECTISVGGLMCNVSLPEGAAPGSWQRRTFIAEKVSGSAPIQFVPVAGLEIKNVFVRELKAK